MLFWSSRYQEKADLQSRKIRYSGYRVMGKMLNYSQENIRYAGYGVIGGGGTILQSRKKTVILVLAEFGNSCIPDKRFQTRRKS